MKPTRLPMYAGLSPFGQARVRSFDDGNGGHWQAALMEASFGNATLVLSRIGGDGVRLRPLSTVNFDEASHWLADASDDDLRRCLDMAAPYP